MRTLFAVLSCLIAIVAAGCGEPPSLAATSFTACSDYPTQSKAQKAWEAAGRPDARIRDRDGDGRVCESLPKSGSGSSGSGSTSSGEAKTTNCVKTKKVVDIGISRTKSPETVRHFEDAIKKGYPSVLTIDRAGANENRSQSLSGIDTAPGMQRDEYPPAISAEGGIAERGPKKGQRASVRLIPSLDNSRSGASMGAKLRRYCDSQQFRLIGY